ncbi:MAG: Mini-ribonuclease 3 [Eubacteriales bacterium]
MKSNELNGMALAYLGDAVIELMAREAALKSGITDVGRLNAAVSGFVRATAQSAAVGRIEQLLNEEEKAIYKRGRNTHGMSIPKSASVAEYRRSTGFEALFAYLYLEEKRERMADLFNIAFGLCEKAGEINE